MEFWNTFLLWDTAGNWIIASGALILTFLGLRVLQRVLTSRITALSVRTKTSLDDFAADLAGQTKWLFLLVLAIYVASLFLQVPDSIQDWVNRGLLAAFLVQVAFWVSALVIHLVTQKEREHLDDDAANVTTLHAFGLIARIVLWAVVLLLILQNITGIKIDALVASLGITGVAVALAVQNILGDLFASLSIALDKPFVIGDFVIVGDYLGTVEHIGLKSTRLRSLSGEQLVFSNSDLLGSRIRNYKRMDRRRVVFTIGVTYQTPYEKLATIPETIKEIISSLDNVTFDRAHFKSYGDFSLNFEIVYYMESPDYNEYMDKQQDINLALFKRFEAEGIEFAYPTQTLFVENSVLENSHNRVQKALDAP